MLMTEGGNIRRLQDLVHTLGSKSALHQIANGNSSDEGGQPGVLALLLRRAFFEYLGWAE